MNESIRRRFWRRVELAHEPGAYAILDAAYRQPHRAYHTWDHIDALLEAFDRFEALAARPDLVAIAVIWHDAVYQFRDADGRRRTDVQNVRDSVALFRRCSRLGPADEQAVAEMVMATADHVHAKATAELYPGFSADLDLVIDLDLSPLAASGDVFADNTHKLRSESACVEEAKYATEVANLLERFSCDGRPIFRRPETRALWDAAAHANLAMCIPRLRAAAGGRK